MPIAIQFMEQETRDKKYTVKHAIDAARAVLSDRRVHGVNTTSVNGRDEKEKITLVQLNDISEQIIVDSSHHR